MLQKRIKTDKIMCFEIKKWSGYFQKEIIQTEVKQKNKNEFLSQKRSLKLTTTKNKLILTKTNFKYEIINPKKAKRFSD